MTPISPEFSRLSDAVKNPAEPTEKFRRMIDSLPAAIYTTDAEGRLTYYNPAAVEFSGRKPKLGTDQWCVTLKLYHPDGRHMPHDQCPMALALKEERPILGTEAIAERPDGKRVWFRPYPSPIRDDNGKVIGGINMLIDLSEEKKAQKRIRQNEKELNDFFDNATVGLHFVGPDGIIQRVNQAELDLLGYSREEYVGRHIADFHADSEVIGDILKRLKNREELHDYEAPLLCKDGSVKHVLISSNVYEEDGKFIHTRCFTRDITERKRAKAELKKMNETLEHRVAERTSTLKSYQEQLRSLASELSKAEERERQRLATELHDNLGQMLAVGKMQVDLIQKGQMPDNTSADIGKLKELMDDALAYTRNLMSELKPPPALDDEDIRANLKWIAKKMQKHGLEVSIEEVDQKLPIENEVQTTVSQCIRELLFNVVKHASVSKAHIGITPLDTRVLISVEDKGEGFDTGDLNSIATDKGGFGLFNVRERVDLLGGKVEVHSEPGKGTEVTLDIPLKESELDVFSVRKKGITPPPPDKTDAKSSQRIKVLLADDHQMVREGLRKIIEEENDMMVIAEAADGEEAVKLCHEHAPDIVLMDVNMPVMGGIEATQKILSAMSHIRVIGLSLHNDESVIEEMYNVGATAYLTKTEAFEALSATIRGEAISSA